MKKVIYASFLDESNLSGYKYKIHSQCGAIKNIGYDVYLLTISNHEVMLYRFKDNDKSLIFRKKNKRQRIFKQRNILDEFFLFKYFVSILNNLIRDIQAEFLYLRRIVPITPILVKALRHYRNAGVKIFYEYPTFPWEKELLAEKKFLFYFLDKIQFNSLKKSVNHLVIVGADESNFKFPYKVISNAIRVDDIPIISRDNNDELQEINMIGVANVNLFHGFDRLIYGIKKYYDGPNSLKVKFHIVGKISSGLKLEEIVHDLNLQDYVIFHGYKDGQELNNLFNQMHIGVGCLGVHRKNVDSLNSLKNREYAARGLPFIFSETDHAIENKNPQFIIKESFDDSPIDIDRIIIFYKNLKVNPKQIRQFAIKYLNWETEMMKVFNN